MSQAPGSGGLATRAKASPGFVVLLGLLTALGPIAIDMYLPALPAIAKDLGATPSDAQLTVSVFLVGLSLGQLIFGPLSDRYGRRGLMLLGVLLFVAGSAGCMVASDLGALIGFRILQSLGACAGMVLSRAVVRDRFAASEILHVLSMMMLVLGVAPILAPLVGGWVLLVGDWRIIFAIQAAVGAALAIAVLFGLPESRSEATADQARAENPIQSYAALLGRRRFLAYMLAGAASGAALFTYIAVSPDVLIVQQHVPPEHFGWVFGVNGAAVIGAVQINARLARRWPSDWILRRALVCGFAAASLLLVAAATGLGGLWGLLAPLFLVIGSYGFTQGNAQAEAMKVDDRRAGASAALLGAGSFGGGSLAAGVAGLARNGTAVPMAAVILGSLALALLSLAVLAPRSRAL